VFFISSYIQAREFRASPFPDIIYAEHSGRRRDGGQEDVGGANRGAAAAATNQKVVFKARPPTVLMKAPFVPRKSDRVPTGKFSDVLLDTWSCLL